ncbi:acetyltransferase [Spirosoma rhododendri]|uniref:Acetyltransferase n=1 Tax=Spirosoma rhododendri TaxID=2728024 RepID=A0A7L5DZK4_9BACT|nr:acetyltransferase [Spirosoma rhododendri]
MITLVALWTTVGSYIFDWNDTHIYNPAWPPHARFHNAQTMLLGTVIGLTAGWVLWVPKANALYRLQVASALASYYWITQAGSLLFPGTALVDPQFAYPGQPPAQLIVDAVTLVLLTIGFVLERDRLKRNPQL